MEKPSTIPINKHPEAVFEFDQEIGTGYWTRANAEYCLLATRGHPKRMSANVHQVIFEPTREHSRKPDCTRDRIVDLLGDLPRVELFARQTAPGWDSWGDQLGLNNNKYVESVLNG